MLARDQALETMAAERFDVVVIGGGITGAGVALDAATRGYCGALVVTAEFASGTSAGPRSWSTEGCATCSSSISGWFGRRCASAS